MERQNQIITALAIVLLALMAVVVLDKDAGKDDENVDEDAPASRDLFDLEDDKVTRIELQAKGQTTTLEKQDGTWKMTAPKELQVEQRRAEEIIERLNAVRIEERALTGDNAAFGLSDADRAIVTLTTPEKTFSVVVGKDAPVGYRTYAQEEAGGTVHLLSSRVADIVHRGPDDFRSRDVWSFSSFSARRVRIEDAGKVVSLRKDDHGWWLGDEGPRADDSAVTGWLSKASTLKVASFEDGADPAALGLEPARGSLTIEDGEKSWSITLGNGDVARVDGGVVRLGDGLAELLDTSGFASKKLLPIQRYAVDLIEIQLGDKTARFQSQDGAWADSAGKSVPSPDTLFDKLEAVAADRSVSLPAPTAPWGRITVGEGEKRRVVVFGELSADGRRVAKEEVGGPGFTVAQADLDALAAALP